jgi:hypothetical protein
MLRAHDHRAKKVPPMLPSDGLFLSFLGKLGFGRVRLRSGTKFNIMPAQVVPGDTAQDLHVLSVAGEGKWVMFNIREDDDDEESNVALTEEVSEACLFKKSYKQKGWKITAHQEFLLRVEGMEIGTNVNLESSEVSFVNDPAEEKLGVSELSCCIDRPRLTQRV